jgi:hypothetical protein
LIFLDIYRDHKKPAAILEGLTGASRSFCEKVIDGRARPGLDMLEALICSKLGDQVIDAIVTSRAGARPDWHRGFRLGIERDRLLTEIKDKQRRLAALDQGEG